MTATLHRAAIVGGSSLLGKELAEELNQAGGAVWDLTLLDVPESAGQMTAAGDEALVIQPLAPDSFQGNDIVFFAADADTTRQHWKNAIAAGAGVVDLTGALAEEGVSVRAPLLSGVGLADDRLDLSTEAVVAAHAAPLMLGYVGVRLRSLLDERARMSATVLVPASEFGKEAMDELHAQTVALLSFQTLPQDMYDAQVTFNLNAAFGEEARVSLREVSARMRSELQALLGREAAARYAFQCLQAPLFHGCCASVFLPLKEAAKLDAISDALQHGSLLTVVEDSQAAPTNVTGSEQTPMMASLRAETAPAGDGVWLWLVADNLRLMARNAVGCAGDLLAIRPAVGRVQ